MRKWKRFLSVATAMTLVLANVSSAFAKNGYDDYSSNNKTKTYDHIAISVNTVDEVTGQVDKSGYVLAEKPTVYLVETVEKEVTTDEVIGSNPIYAECETCDSIFWWFPHDCNDGEIIDYEPVYKTEIVKQEELTEIKLNRIQNSQKNGNEYQSGTNYKFTTDSVFRVDAKLVNQNDETDVKEITVTITDVENYLNSGYSFYEYCKKNYCDGRSGIDMKLTYTQLIEFLDVKYDVDGDVDKIIDEADYEAGDVVTISNEVPEKEGYRFEGWKYGEEVYEPGDEFTMPEDSVTFVAQWTKLYTVTYKVDGNVVSTKTLDEGSDISDWNTFVYEVEDDSVNLSDWTLETADANTSSLDKDVVISATTATKTYTVTYRVNGEVVEEFVVEYGATVNVDEVTYTPDESSDFNGWEVTAGDVENVTSDVIIDGTTELKKFTVTYLLDGKQYGQTYTVNYGDKVNVNDVVYTPEAGYTFSQWEVTAGDADYVTSNVVIEGTTEAIEYTVTFVDANGEVLSQETYNYNEAAEVEASPSKADNKYVDDNGAAKWYKYSFKTWMPAGEYTLDDLSGVKADMTFTAAYTEREVVVKYFILNEGLEQPAEQAAYPTANYSKGLVGTIASFEQIANNDEAVAANLVSVPTGFQWLDGTAVDENVQIKWYVIKMVNDYEWHVDGIIENQMYDITVNYVDANGNAVAESDSTQAAAATEYTLEAKSIEGYNLAEGQVATVTGTMPYDNVEYTFVYDKVQVSVTYFVDGQQYGDADTYFYGEDAALRADYEAEEGYRFSGWDKTAEDLADLKANVEVNGTTIKTYTVSYFLNNEPYGKVEVVDAGSSVELREDYNPGEGYTFSGWDVDENKLADVSEDIEIYGTTNKNIYTVTYYVDGEYYTSDVVEYGDVVDVNETEYTPNNGYDFSGWTTVEGSVDPVTGNVDVYGTTSIQQYNLTINYVDEAGNKLADSVEAVIDAFAEYRYESPEIEGYYMVDGLDATVMGVMPADDLVIDVVYAEEEIIDIDIPFADGGNTDKTPDAEPEDDTDSDSEAEEEEEVEIEIPFADGAPKTDDSSNVSAYVMMLLMAAMAAVVAAYVKKNSVNE